MDMKKYILDENGNPVECTNILEWADWIAVNHKPTGSVVVRQEEVKNRFVSTVFLGIDHSFGGNKPILFETMVFKDQDDDKFYQERYSTRDEAIQGHEKAVRWVMRGCKNDAQVN